MAEGDSTVRSAASIGVPAPNGMTTPGLIAEAAVRERRDALILQTAGQWTPRQCDDEAARVRLPVLLKVAHGIEAGEYECFVQDPSSLEFVPPDPAHRFLRQVREFIATGGRLRIGDEEPTRLQLQEYDAYKRHAARIGVRAPRKPEGYAWELRIDWGTGLHIRAHAAATGESTLTEQTKGTLYCMLGLAAHGLSNKSSRLRSGDQISALAVAEELVSIAQSMGLERRGIGVDNVRKHLADALKELPQK